MLPWNPTTITYENRLGVFSYAEVLFGEEVKENTDYITFTIDAVLQVLSSAFSIVMDALTSGAYSAVALGVQTYQVVFSSVSLSSVYPGTVQNLMDEYINAKTPNAQDVPFRFKMFSWLVDLFNILDEYVSNLVDSYYPTYEQDINIYKK